MSHSALIEVAAPTEIEVVELPLSTTTVEVRSQSGSRWTVPIFAKADGKRYLRFWQPEPGEYAVIGPQREIAFPLETYQGDSPLLKHGKLKHSDTNGSLQHADGSPFFWLADTWWYGNTTRAAWPSDFKQVVANRIAQGFSVSMIVVGEPPEVKAQTQHAANEGGLPFLPNHQPNPAYLDATDQRLWHMIEQGIVPCIVGSWAYHIDTYGANQMTAWWQQLVARYAAWPVVFCLAGELGLAPGQLYFVDERGTKPTAPTFIRGPLRKIAHRLWSLKQRQNIQHQLQAWRNIGTELRAVDPFQTLITCHTNGTIPVNALLKQPTWLDIDTVQTGHDAHTKPLLGSLAEKMATHLPWLNLEPWYEQIFDQFGPTEQRYAFWSTWLTGAAGVCYGAQGLWNMATADDHFMGHWGKSSWQQALMQPGGEQIGLAKNWLTDQGFYYAKPASGIISPTWTITNPNQPLAGKCHPDTFVIYFPEKSLAKTCQLHLPAQPESSPNKWQTQKIDPATMSPATVHNSPDELWLIWYNGAS